jgi:hypothetical protein
MVEELMDYKKCSGAIDEGKYCQAENRLFLPTLSTFSKFCSKEIRAEQSSEIGCRGKVASDR